VCERERERWRSRERCGCVCVREREREREGGRGVCVCACRDLQEYQQTHGKKNSQVIIADKYGLNPSQVSLWKKDSVRIQLVAQCKIRKERKNLRRGSGRRLLWPKMEERLASTVRERRRKGWKVKTRRLTTLALKICQEEYPEDGQDFKASCRWRSAFGKRNKLSKR
jgi:hypothetical protein